MIHRCFKTLALALAGFMLLASISRDSVGAADAPRVVASTSWVAAFAEAAGATNVSIIAPADFPHPPDYDPRPSDLAKVAGAEFVLMAPFDGFAKRLREASGSSAQIVEVDAENTPAKIRSEVTRLGKLFGTEAAAQSFLSRFDAEYARLSASVKVHIGEHPPTVVAHRFMAYWSDFAGLPLVGVYGPRPLTAQELAALVAKKPGVVFENGQTERGSGPSDGRAIADATGAKEVQILNFPGPNEGLLWVFEENARRIIAAIGK